MHNNLNSEWIAARERRRALLHRAVQNRLICLAKARSESITRADRRTQDRQKIRMEWRQVIV